MKKLLLSITLLFGIIIQSPAQNTFAPLGAEWWYQGSYTNYCCGSVNPPLPPYYYIEWTDHVQIIKDTIIDGISCRQMEVTRMQKHSENPDPDESYLAQNLNYYIYDNTDTVFIYDDSTSQFLPLYVFNAAVNDTVCLFVPFNNLPGTNTEFCFVIDSIRTELYDTSHLKSFYTHTIIDSSNPYGGWNWGGINWQSIDGPQIGGKITERIGANWHFNSCLLPHYSQMIVDGETDIYNNAPNGNFRCYSDSSYSIKTSDIPCDSIPNPPYLSIHNIDKSLNSISIYPNPANENLTIEVKNLNQDIDITLYDMQGRSIKKLPVIKGNSTITLNTNDITAGIYWLNIQTSNGHYAKKITIIH